MGGNPTTMIGAFVHESDIYHLSVDDIVMGYVHHYDVCTLLFDVHTEFNPMAEQHSS